MKRGKKKKSYQVPAGRKIPITKINCSKYCLCRTDIFIKHLPSRADALQNSQLMRGHGTGGSGARYPGSVPSWPHWTSAYPHPGVSRGMKTQKHSLHHTKSWDRKVDFLSIQKQLIFWVFFTKWTVPPNFPLCVGGSHFVQLPQPFL